MREMLATRKVIYHMGSIYRKLNHGQNYAKHEEETELRQAKALAHEEQTVQNHV